MLPSDFPDTIFIEILTFNIITKDLVYFHYVISHPSSYKPRSDLLARSRELVATEVVSLLKVLDFCVS